MKATVKKIVIALVVLASCTSRPAKTVTLPAEVKTMLENQISSGYLVIEQDFNRVYVASHVWSQLDYKGKENFAAFCAVYIGNQTGSNTYWAHMYDKQTGRKLAEWSQSWGFDVED